MTDAAADGRPSTVAESIIDLLAGRGITTVFGVHGANSEDLFTAALRHGDMRVTIAKHEFGAGAMADGAFRITGGVGCLITTSGGGAMNALPALAEAYESRSAVLALIGCAPTVGEGRGAFQDMVTPPATIDAEGAFRAVTGYTARIGGADDVEPAMRNAFAALHRGLPAALLLPKDVQTAHAPSLPVLDDRPADTAIVTDAVGELVRAATSPVIILGENASRALGPDDVAALASAIGAVVAVTPNGRDACPPYFAVGVTGIMGHPSAHAAISGADLVLVVGARLSMTDRAGLDESFDRATVVHVDSEPPLRPVTMHVHTTDLRAWITDLHKTFGTYPPPRPGAVRHLPITQPPTTAVAGAAAVDRLSRSIPLSSNIFADAGNAGAAAVHYLPAGCGTRFVVALGAGGMGWAVAAGVGAARVTRQRSVIIAGDGAFFMHGMEIHTALEYSLPVTLVIMNNDAHGMCVTREHKFFPDVRSVNTFGHTDFGAGLAALFPRLTVRTATTADQVGTAAAELFDSTAATNCLVINTDPSEIPPFATLI